MLCPAIFLGEINAIERKPVAILMFCGW